MKPWTRGFLLGLLPGLLLSVRLSASPPVDVSNPVYGFLRRLEELGVVDPGFTSTLPRDEDEVCDALLQAEKAPDLTAWDRSRLERFLDEFDPARKWNGSVLHYRDSLFLVQGGIEFYSGSAWQDSLPKAESYVFNSFSPAVEARYRNHLYLISQATVGNELSAVPRFVENYDPQRGMFYNTNREGKLGQPQTMSTFDGYRTVLGFGNPELRFEAGQDWNQWGPGHWEHTTLGARPFFWAADSLAANDSVGFRGSDSLFPGGYRRGYRVPGEAAPLPQFRMRIDFGPFEYVKIIAQRTGLWTDSSAYLIAHRLQVRLGRRLRFAVSEMLALGRNPDWGALLPGVPLKFAEHAGGNRDNSALSTDGEWLWGRGRVYGEFYIDDFSGPPLEFWGNKFAWVLGGSWQNPLRLPAELHLEYAHIDPWVYEHDQHNTAFQSGGALLGSMLPPNSQALFSSADFPLPGQVQGEVEWQWRQRDLGSPGSSIFDVHTATDSDIKQFLENNVETRNQLTATFTWSWRRYLTLKAGGGGLWVYSWHGYGGETLASPTAFGEIHLRY